DLMTIRHPVGLVPDIGDRVDPESFLVITTCNEVIEVIPRDSAVDAARPLIIAQDSQLMALQRPLDPLCPMRRVPDDHPVSVLEETKRLGEAFLHQRGSILPIILEVFVS